MTAHHNGSAHMAAGPIRVAVIDGTPLMRIGLSTIIDGDDGLRLVADGHDGHAIARANGARRADVILIDPWSGSGGIDGLQRICEEYPDARIIVMSHALTADRVAACMNGLAHGCVDKAIAPSDLPSIVRQVVAGLRIMPALPRRASHALTPRELEMLRAAASGKSNAQIATDLFVTEQTVKFHLSNVYRKLGARNRTEAAHTGRVRGLLD